MRAQDYMNEMGYIPGYIIIGLTIFLDFFDKNPIVHGTHLFTNFWNTGFTDPSDSLLSRDFSGKPVASLSYGSTPFRSCFLSCVYTIAFEGRFCLFAKWLNFRAKVLLAQHGKP